MDRLGELEGTITDTERNPLSGVVIHVNQEGGDRFLEVTHETGSFDFRRLPPGAYMMVCTKEGYRRHETRVAISADRTTHQDLVLSKA